ncbi:SDR family NAD(P)-dependent oxidoreductase [Hwanghaeella grinnelliae]|uniref:SDR family NAD(P)-dependent oxidoreductase n=1 Tax=Hwanghaeella grinnelliae TaxID=2500179 RepID=A0A437QV37_9PROT|nr:SDR family NAD(P)-dependent oxidoreductase [Hwanghaeella grinnelliae]RVU38365.1 SDR family NAD(P)-dependent oxidoreductase [Hwanghaeella grinnelliae]
MAEKALIVGTGAGLSASLARLFKSEGMEVAIASRSPKKNADLADELGAANYRCDAADIDSVADLFTAVEADMGAPDIVVYNPSARVRGPVTELDPVAVRDAVLVTAYGAFLVAQQAAKRMEAKGSGTLMFTGASAGVKGYPNSSCFAIGKFGLRGLAQSLARELQPKNIHVAHFVIDGGIESANRPTPADNPDSLLNPDAIAESYLHVHRQHRSAWTWEIELRPWVEKF